jgi:hypothetical protein
MRPLAREFDAKKKKRKRCCRNDIDSKRTDGGLFRQVQPLPLLLRRHQINEYTPQAREGEKELSMGGADRQRNSLRMKKKV